MLVKELRAALRRFNEDTEAVIQSRGYSRICFQAIEETYEGEFEFPVEAVINK